MPEPVCGPAGESGRMRGTMTKLACLSHWQCQCHGHGHHVAARNHRICLENIIIMPVAESLKLPTGRGGRDSQLQSESGLFC